MARKLFGIVAAVALASGAMFTLVGPASAGVQTINALTITKTVIGDAPSGTVFVVNVSCTSGESDTRFFDETGQPSDSTGNPIIVPAIPAASTDACTVSETFSGGANSVTYHCAVGASDEGTTCPASNRVQFTAVRGDSATISVTNTFDPAPTTTSTTIPLTTTTTLAPKPAPAPVVAAARFTG